ncbi:hypothetical protein [Spirulina subsalsa]|nr:hypothetical protein [Spirulina subsalsa]
MSKQYPNQGDRIWQYFCQYSWAIALILGILAAFCFPPPANF